MSIIKCLRKRSTKVTIFILLCVYILRCLFLLIRRTDFFQGRVINQKHPSVDLHLKTVNDFYMQRQNWSTSKLGAILFKGEEIPNLNVNDNKTFTILIWRYWDWLKNRHVFSYGFPGENINILAGCSVQNCIITGDNYLIESADAIIIPLQKTQLPNVKEKNPKQRWIFLIDESPVNKFYESKKKVDLKDYSNVFNWSMTYRYDADVPVPYGRTIPLDEPIKTNSNLTEIATLVPYWEQKQRKVPATILISHCGVKDRSDFLNKLMKYVNVDVYGKCSKNPKFRNMCRGHFRQDCNVTSRYLFYLALENSHCFQYLTEKVWHAYAKGAVPIIWGAPYEDLRTLLPPNSFIYADENTNVELLARKIINLAENDDLILSMHRWRNHFKVVDEHGYFGTKSYHLCRLCEALNYNDQQEKIFSTDDLRWFLDENIACKREENTNSNDFF